MFPHFTPVFPLVPHPAYVLSLSSRSYHHYPPSSLSSPFHHLLPLPPCLLPFTISFSLIIRAVTPVLVTPFLSFQLHTSTSSYLPSRTSLPFLPVVSYLLLSFPSLVVQSTLQASLNYTHLYLATYLHHAHLSVPAATNT